MAEKLVTEIVAPAVLLVMYPTIVMLGKLASGSLGFTRSLCLYFGYGIECTATRQLQSPPRGDRRREEERTKWE